MAMPRVAVVIPVHNRAAVVRRAIDSVLAQDFADFEIAVVDDASTDDTPAAVAAVTDPRVRLYRQDRNGGGNAARNRGVEETSAPLIAFLDSDDEYLPEKLSTLVALFDANPTIDAVLDSYVVINPAKYGDRPVDRLNPVLNTSEQFLAALFDSSVKARRMRKSASGITLRRATALAAGPFDEQLKRRQDMEYLIRVAKAGRCIATDRKLWIKHDLSDGITATSTGFMPATLHICRRHPEYATDPAYRSGLARDVVRHLWEWAHRGQWRQLGVDWRLLSGAFGTLGAVRLAGRGIVVLVRGAL